ncbi:hypothetical protein RLEG12_24525 [Rhizobium leguminosarum bv. trifolii CB782]|nr:hypothetical protein RLEG12_24525 [Rhizobium leguminosarum bv. trifolii CB782]
MRALSVISFAAVVCALAASSVASAADGFGSFSLQSAKVYSYQQAAAPDGSKAERFELRSGDCPSSTGDCQTDRERVEKWENKPASRLDHEYWYHFSVFIPKDWPAGGSINTKLGQFHQFGNGKPPVLFEIQNGQYIFELSNPSVRQASPMHPLAPLRQIGLTSANAMKGRWTSVTVNANWSRTTAGFINVWVNGAKKVALKGPNVDRDSPVYFKYGVYRSFVSRLKSDGPLVAWYNGIRRGSSRNMVDGTQ